MYRNKKNSLRFRSVYRILESFASFNHVLIRNMHAIYEHGTLKKENILVTIMSIIKDDNLPCETSCNNYIARMMFRILFQLVFH